MGYDLDNFIDPSGTNSIKWEFMSLFAPNATEKAIPMGRRYGFSLCGTYSGSSPPPR